MASKKISQLPSGSTNIPLSGQTAVVYSGITHQQTLSSLRQILVNSGSHYFTGSQFINGNLVVTGSIIAQEYIVSSSVSHITTQTVSGSSNFGDTLDDKHNFTGSVYITGSLIINGTSYTAATSGTSGTSGESGTSGIDGTSGTSGESGTSGSGFVWQGEWQEIPATYVGGQDVVSYEGGSYIKIGDGNSGSAPPNDSARWEIVANPGTSGTSGDSGSSGTSGESGTSGTSGESGTSGTSGESAKGTTCLFISATRTNGNPFFFTSIQITSDNASSADSTTAFMITSNLLNKVTVYLRQDSAGPNSVLLRLDKNADGTAFSTASPFVSSSLSLSANVVQPYVFSNLTLNQFDTLHFYCDPTNSPGQLYGIVVIE